jgi:hypothetical protein
MGLLAFALRKLLCTLRVIREPELLAQQVQQHPSSDDIRAGRVYVVTSHGHPKWAYLRSPSDPDEVIQLSLMPNRRPSWKITIDVLERPTISPSVRQLAGSYAHFWVKKGAIEWCDDTGQARWRDSGIRGATHS